MGAILHKLFKVVVTFYLHTQPIDKSTVVLLQGFITQVRRPSHYVYVQSLISTALAEYIIYIAVEIIDKVYRVFYIGG